MAVHVERKASKPSDPQASRRQRFRFAPWLLVAMILFASYVAWQLTRIEAKLARISDESKESLFWDLCHGEADAAVRSKAFQRLVQLGNAEWRSARLHGLSLPQVDLHHADLREGDFEASDFREANFRGCRLQGAQLLLVDFTAADLSGAAMDGANLTKAVLVGCRLDEARLPAATMRQIEGSGATFIRADLSDADLLMSDFSEANFAGANLSSASMRSTVLRGANLTLADLAGADLAGVDLRGSNWWRARGLTADQLDDFAERFRPSAETDPQRAEDFLQWLELGRVWGGGTSGVAARPSPTLKHALSRSPRGPDKSKSSRAVPMLHARSSS